MALRGLVLSQMRRTVSSGTTGAWEKGGRRGRQGCLRVPKQGKAVGARPLQLATWCCHRHPSPRSSARRQKIETSTRWPQAKSGSKACGAARNVGCTRKAEALTQHGHRGMVASIIGQVAAAPTEHVRQTPANVSLPTSKGSSPELPERSHSWISCDTGGVSRPLPPFDCCCCCCCSVLKHDSTFDT